MTTAQQFGFLDTAAFDGRPFVSVTLLAPDFGGITYDPARDGARLTGQLAAVFQVMRDGRERTLVDLAGEVCKLTGRRASEAAVSARIRDLRKAQFGGHRVDHRNAGGGLWYYRLTVREGTA